MASSEFLALLRRPRFARYYATVTAARATGVMFSVAGVLLVLEKTHDLALAGLVVAAAALPAAVTGPFLGGWLDVTANRRRLLVLDRVVTGAALVAFLLLTGHAPNWLLPVVALLYGITSPLSAGGFASVLPEVAGQELLDTANAFEGASINVAFIVGPALAGAIAGAAGPAQALEVQIAAGVLLTFLIASDDTFELRPHDAGAAPASVLHAVREGLAATWRIAPLRWNTLVDCSYVLAWGTLNVGLPAFAVSVGSGAHAAGYMWAAVAAGSMIGGFALRLPVVGRRSPWRSMGVFFLAMAASAAAWLLAGSLAVALGLIFLTGVLDGPGLVALVSIRQRLAPPHLRAQIFTTANSVHNAMIAAGAAGAGLLHSTLGTDATLLSFAVLIGIGALISLAAGAAERRDGAGSDADGGAGGAPARPPGGPRRLAEEPLEATIRRR